MEPRLTIQIVGWNSAVDLPRALAALSTVPADQATIRYIDNGSSDTSVALVRAALPAADIITLPENTGFAAAHNEGLRRCTTPFVLLHDPDLALEWSGIAVLLEKMEQDPLLGAGQGKLHRVEKVAGESLIDSAGIIATRAFNGRERGAGEPDHGQYETAQSIWAATGACALYRVQALREIAYHDQEVFDEYFFSYKEDVDVGWRLHRAGWKVWYFPVVTGVHQRSLGRRGRFGWGNSVVAVYKRLQSRRTRYSLRNWMWMIVKNATWSEVVARSVYIGGRVAVFVVASVAYPPLVTVWLEILRGLPQMRQRR